MNESDSHSMVNIVEQVSLFLSLDGEMKAWWIWGLTFILKLISGNIRTKIQAALISVQYYLHNSTFTFPWSHKLLQASNNQYA